MTAVLLLVADLIALCWWTPSSGALMAHLRDPYGWVSSRGADGAAAELAGAALWCWAVWVAIGLLAALLASTPGRIGALSDAVARRSLPSLVRRIVVGSLGVGLALTPVLAPGAAGATPAGGSGSSAPQIGWPTDDAPVAPIDIPWPSTPSTPSPRPAAAGAVTVRAGDSLWLMAARQLGPTATPAQIAVAWPRWYRANVTAIGADPNLIHPGQQLVPPIAKGSTP